MSTSSSANQKNMSTIYVSQDIFDVFLAILQHERPFYVAYKRGELGIHINEVKYMIRAKDKMVFLSITNPHWELDMYMRIDEHILIRYKRGEGLTYLDEKNNVRIDTEPESGRSTYICVKNQVHECINVEEYITALLNRTEVELEKAQLQK